jgi:hypothetical protein
MASTARRQAELNVLLEDMYSLHDICKIYNVPEDLLRRWTEANMAPHYDIEGVSEPYFRRDEIFRWINDNAVRRVEGLPVPRAIGVVIPYTPVGGEQPPTKLAGTSNLCWVPVTAQLPGVYFLCRGQDVVYVGQSDKVLERVCAHIREGVKEFDHERIFFLPCPREQLLMVEAQYIELFKPRYNRAGI